MTKLKFYKKLQSVGFTMADCKKLKDYAFRCFADAHGWEVSNAGEESVAYEFVCSMVWDESSSLDDFNNYFRGVIGRELTPEEFKKLDAQLDIEW